MTEKEILAGLQEIDNVLAKCVNPPLTRADHDAIKNIMSSTTKRVKLSYQLEAEKTDVAEPKE